MSFLGNSLFPKKKLFSFNIVLEIEQKELRHFEGSFIAGFPKKRSSCPHENFAGRHFFKTLGVSAEKTRVLSACPEKIVLQTFITKECSSFVFGHWAITLCSLSESFWQGCQNCILQVHRTFVGSKIFSRKYWNIFLLWFCAK